MGKRKDKAAKLQELNAIEEERHAWSLKRQGFSYDAIAQEMGVSRATAWRRVNAARQLAIEEAGKDAEADRAEQIAQIDDTIATANAGRMNAVHIMVDPTSGETRTIMDHKALASANMTILRALDQKAKLTGTYAAVAVDVTATVTHVDAKDAELASMLDKLGPRVETAPQQ